MTSHAVDWLLDPLPPGTQVDAWRLVRHRGEEHLLPPHPAEVGARQVVALPHEGERPRPFQSKLVSQGASGQILVAEKDTAALARYLRLPVAPERFDETVRALPDSGYPHALGDFGLERVDMGPKGCHPARAERVQDELLLDRADIGLG